MGPALLAAALLAACGEGRAIFNVDVLSFLQPQGRDTLHYSVLGGTIGSASIPAEEITMVGLAPEEIDSVIVTVTADVENATGAGSVIYEVYFGPESLTVYAPANLYAADTVTVSGADTSSIAPLPIMLVGDTLFARQSLWAGARASVNASPGVTVNGKVRLTRLDLRIVADVSPIP